MSHLQQQKPIIFKSKGICISDVISLQCASSSGADTKFVLPMRKGGRPSKESALDYKNQCETFSDALTAFQESVGFKISSRGWGYHLESMNLIDKSEFTTVESAINELRKTGYLPINFTASDKGRSTLGIVGKDYDVEDELEYQRENIVKFISNSYTPTLLCDKTKVYIEVIVEKVDLVGLFHPVCKLFQIPITNLKGWSDINSRADIIKRCIEKHDRGYDVTLLYCGDFDPAGIKISDTFKKNLKDLEPAFKHDLDFIDFSRFGLNHRYIVDNDLIWTDNLISGSGKDLADPKHKDNKKPYVQDYIGKYGKRKVEANALLKDIPKARDLIKTTINMLVSDVDLENYQEDMKIKRDELLKIFDSQWLA